MRGVSLIAIQVDPGYTCAWGTKQGHDARQKGTPPSMTTPTAQSDLAAFIRKLPCQVFATLSTRFSRPQPWWDTSIAEWLLRIQESERVTLGWLRGDEKSYQLHSHLILIAPSPLNCQIASQHWLSIVDTRDSSQARVERYDPTRGALEYVAKLYGTDSDRVSLGGHLNAMSGDPPSRAMLTRDRRRFKRFEEQKARAASSSR